MNEYIKHIGKNGRPFKLTFKEGWHTGLRLTPMPQDQMDYLQARLPAGSSQSKYCPFTSHRMVIMTFGTAGPKFTDPTEIFKNPSDS